MSLSLPLPRVRAKREILLILYILLYIFLYCCRLKTVVLFGVVAIIICITVNYMCFRFVVWFVDFGDFLSRYPPQTLVTVCRSFVVFIF